MAEIKDRAPVVVVLGHVDHGKTTLLDYIRKSNRASREIGGITQTIGAYTASVKTADLPVNKITFIDTPGHEAFTKLRLQGANVADIAILVVDGVDSLMPQTLESIAHIQNAKIPYVIAVNKMDMPGASLEKVKKDLSIKGVLVEGAGGDVPVVPISAKTGDGVDHLLETVLVMASMHKLTYTEDGDLQAYIIESKTTRAGIALSVIVKNGKLSVGDTVFAGTQEAKIKSLMNDDGVQVREVLPSDPCVVLGFKELPEVGISLTKKSAIREVPQGMKPSPTDNENEVPFDHFAIIPEEAKKLKIVLKTDTQGSLDALLASLSQNTNIEIILSGLGDISKSDIFLAKVTGAIVIGFSLGVDKLSAELAKEERVVIKTYNIIYELLEELFEVSDLIAEKEQKEKSVKGEAKIVATFVIEKEKIAGMKIIKGKINMNDTVELYRNEKLITQSKVVSLRQRAKTVPEVKKNEEAGALFYPELDFVVGDVIKSYSI
ncbi:hypothetical protein A3D80_01320 [Candidatus Roizmanbacteria bacterium RIFCSPHIGHO2_02_FULL_40_13b]|uniref:Tr-type G domain-containing protein n=1 Tax=Candidatus Roizmanbacteria bacterium RIFCSPHIGHO2_01_FULL_39_24 TaxID=1802032 RepID=A0A1F7GJ86_9BACT|nr:MAG: hypothetical protein A2799_04085 [Candidatus Roizmanbacteria bacterium RIFCSPHIGHO2_01_FULL_39_24]OGK26161.1 MAG: hypothetical protein A3D80_01320 [Candidatus Roizmanbacteria bacterium RIFCSPHIGHO2_02_FULL_40_13b]OGK49138.1 MAG: hypothetical protein A3A56_00845 [Candidatus Roizmanbacteria bacterium RIFCSPLOWO2_01_FULL_40_32]OGK57351.1 MAG: hypothetical protein A3H83_01055 [Candidatus Roizmanbacteria bacterium RIFCSPLOWO2_02_FULL_39_8]